MVNDMKSIIKKLLREGLEIPKIDLFDLEDKIFNIIPDNCLYHGSKDISWFKSINDINTFDNSANAKSKYMFLSPKKSTAFNYSIEGTGSMKSLINDKSGILAFKLSKSKGKKLTNKDFKNMDNTIDSFEAIFDNYKKLGYDYVINTLDGNNYVILNNNILKFIGSYYTINAIK